MSSLQRKPAQRKAKSTRRPNPIGERVEGKAHKRSGKTAQLNHVIERELKNAAAARGANVGILDELAAHGFGRDELFEFVVPRRTLERRLQANQPLTLEESGRAFRLARLTALAERVFGDETKAHRWMRKPSRMLEGSTPLSFLKTETGAHMVEQALHRIDYGMFA
jgi:putative toxin-antitoxin system antitoxin component (TIGR02293 family)